MYSQRQYRVRGFFNSITSAFWSLVCLVAVIVAIVLVIRWLAPVAVEVNRTISNPP